MKPRLTCIGALIVAAVAVSGQAPANVTYTRAYSTAMDGTLFSHLITVTWTENGNTNDRHAFTMRARQQ